MLSRAPFVLCITVFGELSFGARFRIQNIRKDTYRQRLENFRNTQYWGNLTIGEQNFLGIFDTGSLETIVRSTRCEDCVHASPPYDHSKSSTYVKNGTKMIHVLGSGPCSAQMAYESIEVGPMEIQRQAFWEILGHHIPLLDTAKFAAIVGMGPGRQSSVSQERTLLAAYGVEEFSICLERGSGRPGWLSWGPVASDAEKAKHALTVPVDGKFHWAAKLRDVYFSGSPRSDTRLASVCEDGCAALIDSGTSLIAGPTSALYKLSQQVGLIHEDCSNLHQLPTLKLSMGDHEFELPPHAYVMRIKGAILEANSVWDLLFFKPKIRKVDMCIPAFMSLDMMSQFGPVWIFGMPFFRYYHSTFDRRAKTMSFTAASEDCQQTVSASNGSKLSFAGSRHVDFEPTDIEIQSIIPARLSSLLKHDGQDHDSAYVTL